MQPLISYAAKVLKLEAFCEDKVGEIGKKQNISSNLLD